MNTNIRFNTINNSSQLNKKINHIFRQSGNYAFTPNIEIIKSHETVDLMKIGNRKQINKNLTQLRNRLKTHKSELGMLDPSQVSEKKFKAKLRAIEHTKQKIKQLEIEKEATTKGNEKKYREIVLSLTNVPDYLKKDYQFLQAFKSVATGFIREMKLGDVIAAAQHRDQHSPHCHFIIDTGGMFSKNMQKHERYAGMQRKWNTYVKQHIPNYDWRNISNEKIDYIDIDLLKKVDKEIELEISNTSEKEFKQKFIDMIHAFKRPAKINVALFEFTQRLKEKIEQLKTALSEKNDELRKVYALYQHHKTLSEEKEQKIYEQSKKIELRDKQLAKALGNSHEKNNDIDRNFFPRR
jgi:hypothetical protein